MNRIPFKMFLILLPALIGRWSLVTVQAQITLPKATKDSLWAVWNDLNEADTNRLKAIFKLAQLYSTTNLDTSLNLYKKQFDFSVIKNRPIFSAASMHEQAKLFDKMGQFDQAIDCFNKCLDIYTGLNSNKNIAGTLNSIAIFYYDRGMDSLALKYHNKCLDVRKNIRDIKGMSGTYINMGNIYSNRGNHQEAIAYYNRGLKLAESIDYKPWISNALGNIGIEYRRIGDFATAIDYYMRSIKIMELLNDRQGVANTFINIGNIYFAQKDLDMAIDAFSKSLNLFDAILNNRGKSKAILGIGVVLLEKGETAQAISYLEQSIEIAEKHGYKKVVVEAYATMGTASVKAKRYDDAEKWFNKALILSDELGNADVKNGVLIGLCQLRNETQDFNAAIRIGNEYLRSTQTNRNLDYEANCLSFMYSAFKALNRPDSALLMHELYIQMRDSIASEENQKEVMRQQFQYDYEKKELAIQKEMELSALKFEYEKKQAAAKSEKEKEKLRYEEELKRTQIEADYAQRQAAMEAEQKQKDALAKAEQDKKDAIAAEQLRRKNQQRNAFIGGFALTLGLAGVSYRSYRRKQRDNVIITKQKEEVEHKNEEILASITYARRLQEAVLPPPKVVREFFNDSFLLYLPRDIVSGDFYWMESVASSNSSLITHHSSPISFFAVGDCTGHGVPGAMLSVMGLNGLNRALNELKLTEPKDLLIQLTKDLHDAFERNETTVRDGMDMALCALNTDTLTLTFCGANNPLWVARGGEMLQFKPNKRPVGHYDVERGFDQEVIQLLPGDVIYIHSDGYQDQLGGPEGKKFMTKRYREFLLSISTEPMPRQRELLIQEHNAWKGTGEQTDDVCVMGVRV